MISTKRRPGSPISKPPMQIQSAMYIYIYTVFAVAVYLGGTYTLIYIYIYMKYQLTQ